MSCPDLDSLFDPRTLDESRLHVETCVDCQRLVVMAASVGDNIQRGAHCDNAELLIATLATGPLEPDESRWLGQHLGDCRRCSTIACAVLLDLPATEISSAARARIGRWAARAAIAIVAAAGLGVLIAVLVS